MARNQEIALTAIASVAAVVWTGGLIAFQIKQWTTTRGIGLDFATNAFMASLLAIFMRPLTLRYAATFFLFVYLFNYGLVWYRNRASNVHGEKAKWEKARPELGDLSVDQWKEILSTNRRSSFYGIAMLAPYLFVIAMPYQTVVAWFAALYTFLSYQTILLNLNSAPDAVNQMTLRSQTTTIGLLGVIAKKLDDLVKKPVA